MRKQHGADRKCYLWRTKLVNMEPVHNEKKDPFKALLADLHSPKDDVVLSAIRSLRDRGNAQTTREVIRLLANEPSPAVESEVLEYLLDLKDDAAVDPLM